MKTLKNFKALLFVILMLPLASTAQDVLETIKSGQVRGDYQINAQYYVTDSAIGAYEVPEKFKMNAYGNILYTNGNFTAGLRYEAYLNPLEGFDPRYKGNGIPYRFVSYKTDFIELTAGNFYEQFGSGLIFRSYQEWTLGYDNSVDGINVKLKPFKGVTLKGIYGTQRFFWEQGPGIIRGGDAEFFLNDIFPSMAESKLRLTLGGSGISKYQEAQDIEINTETDTSYNIYALKLPLNVAAYAGRMRLNYGGFSLEGEYAYKMNDPSALNDFIYKSGDALLINATYSQKGLGIFFSAKRTDNMSYKSNRLEQGNSLDINFLPPVTKMHTYSLISMYPYATQPNGEIGFQGQVIYTFPRKSTLGGKYGTTITAHYSQVNSLKLNPINGETAIGQSGTDGYESEFFAFGDEKYFSDMHIEIRKKLNRNFKLKATYFNIFYNMEVIEGHTGAADVYANAGILDMTYKFSRKYSLHGMFQGLFTKQDEGDWVAAFLELNLGSKLFFALGDEYNYGNPDTDRRYHYYTVAAGYTHNTTQISLRYGRQREGILCVGGVCRNVPASNGLTLTLTSSF